MNEKVTHERLLYSFMKEATKRTSEFQKWRNQFPQELHVAAQQFTTVLEKDIPYWVCIGFFKQVKKSYIKEEVEAYLNHNYLMKYFLIANYPLLLPVLFNWQKYKESK